MTTTNPEEEVHLYYLEAEIDRLCNKVYFDPKNFRSNIEGYPEGYISFEGLILWYRNSLFVATLECDNLDRLVIFQGNTEEMVQYLEAFYWNNNVGEAKKQLLHDSKLQRERSIPAF